MLQITLYYSQRNGNFILLYVLFRVILHGTYLGLVLSVRNACASSKLSPCQRNHLLFFFLKIDQTKYIIIIFDLFTNLSHESFQLIS